MQAPHAGRLIKLSPPVSALPNFTRYASLSLSSALNSHLLTWCICGSNPDTDCCSSWQNSVLFSATVVSACIFQDINPTELLEQQEMLYLVTRPFLKAQRAIENLLSMG